MAEATGERGAEKTEAKKKQADGDERRDATRRTHPELNRERADKALQPRDKPTVHETTEGPSKFASVLQRFAREQRVQLVPERVEYAETAWVYLRPDIPPAEELGAALTRHTGIEFTSRQVDALRVALAADRAQLRRQAEVTADIELKSESGRRAQDELCQFRDDHPGFDDKMWFDIMVRTDAAILAIENGQWTIHESPESGVARELAKEIGHKGLETLAERIVGEFASIATMAVSALAILTEQKMEKTLREQTPEAKAIRFDIKLRLVLSEMVGPERADEFRELYKEYTAILSRFQNERDKELRRMGLLDTNDRMLPARTRRESDR